MLEPVADLGLREPVLDLLHQVPTLIGYFDKKFGHALNLATALPSKSNIDAGGSNARLGRVHAAGNVAF